MFSFPSMGTPNLFPQGCSQWHLLPVHSHVWDCPDLGQPLEPGLVELHQFLLDSLLKFVQVPLDDIPSLRSANTPTQLGATCTRCHCACVTLKSARRLQRQKFPGQPSFSCPISDTPGELSCMEMWMSAVCGPKVKWVLGVLSHLFRNQVSGHLLGLWDRVPVGESAWWRRNESSAAADLPMDWEGALATALNEVPKF